MRMLPFPASSSGDLQEDRDIRAPASSSAADPMRRATGQEKEPVPPPGGARRSHLAAWRPCACQVAGGSCSCMLAPSGGWWQGENTRLPPSCRLPRRDRNMGQQRSMHAVESSTDRHARTGPSPSPPALSR
jgi:hypothetical protein